MSFIESFFLGLVQGLGEFLPISSSAHLVILPWMFGFKDPGLAFDVALHFGTLIALMAYFWKDWLHLMSGTFRVFLTRTDSEKNEHDHQQKRMLLFLIVATIPGAVVGFFLDDYVETVFRHPLLIALNMALLGVVLWVADRKCRETKDLEKMSFIDSLLIGLFQALALIPGVSRAGITMSTGLFRGLNRVTAARFSFLLATPITFGACVLKVPDFIKVGLTMPTMVGILVATMAGFLSIKYLLKYVQTHGFGIFVYYRFVFAGVVIVYYGYL